MSLNRKLDFYRSASSQKEKEPRKPAVSPGLLAICGHFSAEVLFNEAPVLKIRKKMKLPVDLPASIDLSLLARDGLSGPLSTDKCLFFDLETTGLAGGAGTYAFLIGFAYIRAEQIVCEQYFLPDYGREADLFHLLNDWFGRFDYFVSYNGKSYDMPLLRNRFRLNRQKTSFTEAYHIDLVHYCRRIWKDSLPDCRLGTIESLLLDDVKRTGDIPGAMIPQAYFDYLTTDRIHDIIRIIEHNRQDLFSMPLVLGRLARLREDARALPLDAPAIKRLAKLAAEKNETGFLSVLENMAIERHYAQQPLWWEKARVLKKQNRLRQAAALWERLADHPDYFYKAGRELAMYHEHGTKDFKQAMRIVQQVLHRLEMQAELDLNNPDETGYLEFNKRRGRLEQKMIKKIPEKKSGIPL